MIRRNNQNGWKNFRLCNLSDTFHSTYMYLIVPNCIFLANSNYHTHQQSRKDQLGSGTPHPPTYHLISPTRSLLIFQRHHHGHHHYHQIQDTTTVTIIIITKNLTNTIRQPARLSLPTAQKPHLIPMTCLLYIPN